MKTFLRFQELIAWQKARTLTKLVYQMSNMPGFASDFGLKSQIQRAAVSAMTNIAEGHARSTPKQFIHFLDISRGSAAEVQSLIYVAIDQNYISEKDFEQLFTLSDEVIAIIAGLKKSIQSKT